MTKTTFAPVSLEIHSITHSRTGKVDKPLETMPPCLWCKKDTLGPIFDVIQFGMFADKQSTFCHCSECLNASIFVCELSQEEIEASGDELR